MADWRRTLYIIWFTQFVAVAGFSFVFPFLPLFIQSLGVSDLRMVALWTGISTGASPFSMAIMGPVWGSLSDRFGRKPMVIRATVASAITIVLMGFATAPWHLTALRLMQGIFSGVIAASSTLVASIVPEERRGASLGALQMAWFLGTTLGPLLGGLTGDTVGFRGSFRIAGSVIFLSAILVVFLVHEDFHPSEAGARTRVGYRQALAALAAVGGALIAVLAARTVYRVGAAIFSPALALLVQDLLPPNARVALVTGLVSSAGALGGALGSPIIGGWGDRLGHRHVLIWAGVAAGLTLLPQALTPNAAWLVVFQLLSGFAIGGVLSSSIALMAEHAPGERLGAVFGLDASAVGIANAFGPVLGAGALAAMGLRAPFAVAGIIMIAGSLLVIARVPGGSPPPGSSRMLYTRFDLRRLAGLLRLRRLG